jgi:hypothetical protein
MAAKLTCFETGGVRHLRPAALIAVIAGRAN